MRPKAILWIAVLLLSVSAMQYVSAAAGSCTFITDKTSYHPGENILIDMVCTASGDTGRVYTLNMYNSTNAFRQYVTGTTAGTANLHFYNTMTLPITYPSQNNSYIVMTQTNSVNNATVFFNVSGQSAGTFLLINLNETYGGGWYWDENNAVSAKVQDYNGLPVVGAQCKLDIYRSSDNSVFYTQSGAVSGADGITVFNIYVDYNTYDLGTYKFVVSCQYLSGQTLSEVPDTQYASGYASSTFTVNSYVANISVFLNPASSSISSETITTGCVNFTNSYRTYQENYKINFQALCNLPNQNTIISGTDIHQVDANSVVTYCFTTVAPEIGAAGTGVCQLHAGITPDGAADDMSSDFSGDSSMFNITSTFPSVTIPVYWLPNQLGMLAGQFNTTHAYAVNDTLRIDIAQSVLSTYTLDNFLNGNISYNNGTANITMNCIAATGLVSPIDHMILGQIGIATIVSSEDVVLGTVAVRNDEFHCTITQAIPKGAIINVYATWASQTSFFQQIIAALQSIAISLSKLVGLTPNGAANIATPTIGNYTNITSALVTSTVGTSNLTVNYNITSNNNATRRNLHFVYEFAPVVSGTEGAFVDQNPSIEGYQALSLYQAMTLNQTKSLSITLSPSLTVGNYTMYETIYEVNSPQAALSGNSQFDERLISQKSYSIVVNATMTPAFNGNVIQFNGVSMEALS